MQQQPPMTLNSGRGPLNAGDGGPQRTQQQRVVWDQDTEANIATALSMKLGPEFMSSRSAGGNTKVTYIEGWRAFSIANDVFGFNGWNTSIIRFDVDFVDTTPDGRISLGLSCIVRVELKDGSYHEDVGYGTSENMKSKSAAFEKAKKEAVTDATKRALKTYGNVLGLCSYDKEYNKRVAKMKSYGHTSTYDESEFYRGGNIWDAAANLQTRPSLPTSVSCNDGRRPPPSGPQQQGRPPMQPQPPPHRGNGTASPGRTESMAEDTSFNTDIISEEEYILAGMMADDTSRPIHQAPHHPQQSHQAPMQQQQPMNQQHNKHISPPRHSTTTNSNMKQQNSHTQFGNNSSTSPGAGHTGLNSSMPNTVIIKNQSNHNQPVPGGLVGAPQVPSNQLNQQPMGRQPSFTKPQPQLAQPPHMQQQMPNGQQGPTGMSANYPPPRSKPGNPNPLKRELSYGNQDQFARIVSSTGQQGQPQGDSFHKRSKPEPPSGMNQFGGGGGSK